MIHNSGEKVGKNKPPRITNKLMNWWTNEPTKGEKVGKKHKSCWTCFSTPPSRLSTPSLLVLSLTTANTSPTLDSWLSILDSLSRGEKVRLFNIAFIFSIGYQLKLVRQQGKKVRIFSRSAPCPLRHAHSHKNTKIAPNYHHLNTPKNTFSFICIPIAIGHI